MSKLCDLYKKEVIPSLMSELKYDNIHRVPQLEKIVLSMGLGEAIQNPKAIEAALGQLSLIAGQKAVVTRAKKSIAGFKLREGAQIGCMVSLRKERMWEFLERLIYIALPRVRDFRGLSLKSFDGKGNYTLGIREQLIFPEINFDQVDKIRGLNISIVISASSNEEAKILLQKLGFPFKK